MKLYNSIGPNPHVVRMFIAELGLDIETIEKRQGLKVACLEEIAFEKGYIKKEQLLELAEPLKKNQYGQYLLKIAEQPRAI